MAVRNGVRGFVLFSHSFRKYSSPSLVNLALNEKTGVATATLQKPPVNSLNLELLTALSNTFTELEKNKCRGLILTSSSNSVFSAGLDILEMYKIKIDRFKQFWSTLQETWSKLYGSSYPTVAVINGHAPAGGCLLALCCEYRIMSNNFTIGLNETQLGIVVPTWLSASMRNTIGLRQAELALTTGNLFTTEEALKIGLVDEVAADKEEGILKAEKFLQRYERIPSHARSFTKRSLREADLKDLENYKEKELQFKLEYFQKEQIQKELEIYLELLKQKRKKK